MNEEYLSTNIHNIPLTIDDIKSVIFNTRIYVFNSNITHLISNRKTTIVNSTHTKKVRFTACSRSPYIILPKHTNRYSTHPDAKASLEPTTQYPTIPPNSQYHQCPFNPPSGEKKEPHRDFHFNFTSLDATHASRNKPRDRARPHKGAPRPFVYQFPPPGRKKKEPEESSARARTHAPGKPQHDRSRARSPVPTHGARGRGENAIPLAEFSPEEF